MYALVEVNGTGVFRLPIAVESREQAKALIAEKYNGAGKLAGLVEFCHGRCGAEIEVENRPPSPWYCPDCALWREMTLKKRVDKLLAALTRATAEVVVGA